MGLAVHSAGGLSLTGAVTSWFDETASDRVAGQIDAVAHAELGEDVGAVALDGLLADDEQFRDLPAAVAFRYSLTISDSRAESGSSGIVSLSPARSRWSRIRALTAAG